MARIRSRQLRVEQLEQREMLAADTYAALALDALPEQQPAAVSPAAEAEPAPAPEIAGLQAEVSGPASGVRGQPLTFVLAASDPSAPGESSDFRFTVDWGDGSPAEEIRGPSGVEVTHVFVDSGEFNIQVVARPADEQEDAVASEPAYHAVTITAVALQDDPLHDGQQMLVVGGTAGNDRLVLNTSRGVKVLIGGKNQGSFLPTSRIVVYGQAGHDNIQLAGSLRLSAWLYGGDGNDRLSGGKGSDLLFGGPGNDRLLGKQGNDLMVGGQGRDQLVGHPGDDILVAGDLSWEDSETDLQEIMDVWAGPGGNATTRMAQLADRFVADEHVMDDAEPDRLTGSAGWDWFFYDVGQDKATDLDTVRQKGRRR